MASENVLHFTDGNFDDEVLQSDQPVVVDFWAEWCGPCRMVGPTIEALAEEYAGKVKVGKVDCDSNRQVPMRYNIQGIPTVIIFSGGVVAKSMTGLNQLQKTTLKAAIEEALAG